MRIRSGSGRARIAATPTPGRALYTVRATSYWVVEWAGIGQAGTIPLDFTSRAVITMGEAQVLIR